MAQQGLQMASLRAITTQDVNYTGEWYQRAVMAGLPAHITNVNGAQLWWINQKLGTSYDNLPGAMAAIAAANGATNFSSMGTFNAA